MERQNYATLAQNLAEEFRDLDFTNLTDRSITIPKHDKKILVLIGMRRTGKTSCMRNEIKKLLAAGVSKELILYINFEDERLLPMNAKDLGQLVEAWLSLLPERLSKKCHFFFDEIQNVTDWPLVIRRLHDTEKYRIWLTGSSAKLLSKEIATNLRGRSLSVEVWPFSYSEALLHHKKIKISNTMSAQNKKQAVQFLKKYIQQGGFPEIVLSDHSSPWLVLQEYLQTVIYRDVIERNSVSNISLLQYLLKSMVNNVSGTFSANKFFNDAKSQGMSIGKNTVHDYLEYLNDAFCLFLVSIHTNSVRVKNSNPRKTYFIDSGLARANSHQYHTNLGHLFENVVFMELHRKGYQLSYYKGPEGEEVDFIAEDSKGKKMAVQVCWQIENQNTLEREVRALKSCEKHLKISGLLVTPIHFVEFILSLKEQGSNPSW